MTTNAWNRTVWRGTRYEQRGRSVVLDSPAYIFLCPLCEYRMTAHDAEGAATLRRTHVRICHTERITELAAHESFGQFWDPRPRHFRAGE